MIKKTIHTEELQAVTALGRGNQALRAGEYNEAIDHYETALKTSPGLFKIIQQNIDYARSKTQPNTKNVLENLTTSQSKYSKYFPRRAVIFAAYSPHEIVEEYVINYLRKLKEVADYIICVYDNALPDGEKNKLSGIVNYLLCERHQEYDFGSYKRGFIHLYSVSEKLPEIQELIFCNDSCYGPINSFTSIFAEMNMFNYDFWGLTQNSDFEVHLQSFFLVFSKKVITSKTFSHFMSGIKQEKTVQDVILNYEVTFTKTLSDAGFSWGSFVQPTNEKVQKQLAINKNLTVFPLFLAEHGCELIKVKALKHLRCNWDGTLKTIAYIKKSNQDFCRAVFSHNNFDRFISPEIILFSIIMPTYNRAASIQNSITSVLSQDYENYELIIIDDGSTDDTSELIKKNFQAQLDSRKIIYVRLENNGGVSLARNIGLQVAKGDWISFIDSDNKITPIFLRTFADWIYHHESTNCFYANFKKESDGTIFTAEYDREKLLLDNFIDLGVFVHKNISEYNIRFDSNLKRMVDWDYIIRFTEKTPPIHIPITVMEYNDSSNSIDRISVKESFNEAFVKIRIKNKISFRLSTVIVTYNHEEYIEQAIESACQQIGNFTHDVFIFDDFSTDGTWKIITKLAKKYPKIIKACRQETNVGQGENFRRAIKASRADFVAILEGDDYWTDNEKLQKQLNFLIENHDCSMVFSKIEVHDITAKTKRFLSRQDTLFKNKLDGSDFLAHSSMNLIGNFSCCMYRRHVIDGMPKFMFEGRANEIAFAFYFENYGEIGFINQPMGVYRQHSNGLWSGANQEAQQLSAIKARQVVREVAKKIWVEAIENDINIRKNKYMHITYQAQLVS